MTNSKSILNTFKAYNSSKHIQDLFLFNDNYALIDAFFMAAFPNVNWPVGLKLGEYLRDLLYLINQSTIF